MSIDDRLLLFFAGTVSNWMEMSKNIHFTSVWPKEDRADNIGQSSIFQILYILFYIVCSYIFYLFFWDFLNHFEMVYFCLTFELAYTFIPICCFYVSNLLSVIWDQGLFLSWYGQWWLEEYRHSWNNSLIERAACLWSYDMKEERESNKSQDDISIYLQSHDIRILLISSRDQGG